jgi:hypothetical protein
MMYAIPEAPERLRTLTVGGDEITPILAALRADQVVLVRGASASDADRLVASVAEQFGLRAQLEVQSAFASVHGHRSNIGQHFMSVNKRTDYQFIPAHSEGDQRAGIQLAALHCLENTTDGGASVLLNTNAESPAWGQLRALVKKVDLGGRILSGAEIAAARMMYQINIPEDLLSADDHVLGEQPCPVPGVKLFDVLTRLRPSYSKILGRELPVYWDNVASTDFDAGAEYLELLRKTNLLKQPPEHMAIELLDNARERRVWRSGMRYEELFLAKITHKLSAGDLIIQNNFTWTHSTSNWTPHSGQRKVAVAFA